MIDGRIWFQRFIPWVPSAARGVLSKRLVNVICFLYFSVLIFCVWAVLSLEGSSYHLAFEIFRLMISFIFFFSYQTIAVSKPDKYFSATLQMINYQMINIWLIAGWSCTVPLQCTEMRCTHYWGVFVCRCSLQLRWYGRSNIDAVPAPPWVSPNLLFPLHCDSCWVWLLGDHIPGTKRAQLAWTGLSDTTSCSGCNSLSPLQTFDLNHTLFFFFFLICCCFYLLYKFNLESSGLTLHLKDKSKDSFPKNTFSILVLFSSSV